MTISYKVGIAWSMNSLNGGRVNARSAWVWMKFERLTAWRLSCRKCPQSISSPNREYFAPSGGICHPPSGKIALN